MVLAYMIGSISHGRIGAVGATGEFNATVFPCLQKIPRWLPLATICDHRG